LNRLDQRLANDSRETQGVKVQKQAPTVALKSTDLRPVGQFEIRNAPTQEGMVAAKVVAKRNAHILSAKYVPPSRVSMRSRMVVCTENLVRVDDVTKSPKLAG
jgi:hypothetical protein